MRRAPEARFAEVAEHRSAVVAGVRGDLPREIDDALARAQAGDFARDGGGAFCLFERREGGGVVQVEEDVALLEV